MKITVLAFLLCGSMVAGAEACQEHDAAGNCLTEEDAHVTTPYGLPFTGDESIFYLVSSLYASLWKATVLSDGTDTFFELIVGDMNAYTLTPEESITGNSQKIENFTKIKKVAALASQLS